MENIAEILEGVKTMGIGGHIRPDGDCVDTAKRTACIDHHISNSGFAQVNHIRGEVSSACEVLYGLFDPEKVVRTIAVPIYTGMVHDTGVFQYSSTSPETMRIAGELMKTGFNFSKIIDESFYQKTYVQETQSFKVSLRSNGNVDVSKIAVYFGGGGHMRAAGCDLQGSVYDVINNVTEQICKQFQEQEV